MGLGVRGLGFVVFVSIMAGVPLASSSGKVGSTLSQQPSPKP